MQSKWNETLKSGNPSQERLKVEEIAVAGSTATLHYERDRRGRLIRISSADGRVYYRDQGEERILGDHLARFAEVRLPNGFLRKAHGAGQTWVEDYLWDESGRLCRVDGVSVRRDGRGRIIECSGAGVRWEYEYEGDFLRGIQGPQGSRRIETDQRPGRSGRLPAGWNADERGRLWTVLRPDGSVRYTFLWDGWACIGRIDGPPGEPLAAAFSLDPSNTPVRIITSTGVERLPRDAFGERLVQEQGLPGLFGGAVYDGLVYYQARSMDPKLGAFTTADPWHGGRSDPRRLGGYRGPLPVERAPFGPRSVCQNDPIGRADPTGTNSVLLTLSDLTWSWQNNITSIFGLDLWFNFITSLFGSLSGTNFIGRFFSCGGISSTDRQGAWGILRDGAVKEMIPNPAFTFQHLVYTTEPFIRQLRWPRVFLPDAFGSFEPTYYGSIFRLAPEAGAPVLLSADLKISTLNLPPPPPNVTIVPGLATWTRSGGPGRAVMPGSMIPFFPSGGLHLDNALTNLQTPLSGELQELEPDGDVLLGSVDQQDILTMSGDSTGLAVGNRVLINDAAGVAAIVVIDTLVNLGSETALTVRSEVPIAFGPAGLRLRGLGAPSPQEVGISLVAGQANRLNLASLPASAAPYATNDALLLSQGGIEVGAVEVVGLEASLQVDGALPGGASGLIPPLFVHIATEQAVGNPRPTVVTDTVLEFPAAPPPVGQNDALLIGTAPNRTAVVVTQVNGPQITLDRGIGAAGVVGAQVAWRRLGRGVLLGRRTTAPDGTSAVVYAPDQIRTAPVGGFLWVEDSSSPARLAVRSVTGRDYDALVLAQNAPGNNANPYDVVRFPIQAPDLTGLSFSRRAVIDLPARLSAEAVALHVNILTNPVLTAGGTVILNGTVTGNRLDGTQALPGAGTNSSPVPSEVVVLRQGAALAAALVQQIRVTVIFERNLPLVDVDGLEAVPLANTGPTYAATRGADLVVTVQPTVGGARVQMPRFLVGQLVVCNYTDPAGAARNLRHYRIREVNGTTLTLEGDDVLPDPIPDLTVTRLDVTDPNTGGTRLAIEGTRDPATPDRVTFRVWDRGDFSAGRLVGIVDGEQTLPARVVAAGGPAQDVQIVLMATPPFFGANVDLTQPAVTTSNFINQFTSQDNRITSLSGVPIVLPAGEVLAAVVPYRQRGNSTRGFFSSGTTLIPNDLENYELNRYDALAEHELRHTLQSAYFGPWLLSWFPLFALEGVLEATTGIELPEYSAYVPARLERRGGGILLFIENPPAGVTFDVGDWIQLAVGGEHKSIKLEFKAETNQFRLRPSSDLPIVPEGESRPVSIRKDNHDGWRTFYDSLYFLTTGGLLNTAFGFTYGDGLIGLGKLFYALWNVITGPGKTYPAEIQNEGLSLKVTDTAGLAALQDVARLIIQKDDVVVVRAREGILGDVITLTANTGLSGTVQVSPYDTHTPGSYFDWNSYYPAKSEDAAKPAEIRLLPQLNAEGEPVPDSALTLEPFDVVTVTARDVSRRTTVMAVNGDLAQLEEPPPLDSDRSLRIAKISESDPLADVDTYQFRRLGLNWLRWIFDPYRQFQYALDPESGGFWDILARIGRYMFSSKSWSVLPFFGLWWVDNVFKQANPHYSWMEQDASSQSGDLYSSLGRLRGELNFVGDIARYWFFNSGRSGGLIATNRQDRPDNPNPPRPTPPAPATETTHWFDNPRVIPSLVTTGGGTVEPNVGAQPNPAIPDPGLDVPDIFFAKNRGAPLTTLATNPGGFAPGPLGYVPTSAALEDVVGMYAAFSRPGTHRLTVADNGNLLNSRQAQTDGLEVYGVSWGNQTLFFDVTVQDVTVNVAGQAAPTPAAGAAPPRVTLVLTQRAVISVAPNLTRRYVVTVTNPASPTLQAPRDLELQAGTQPGNDQPVEISRVHRFRDGAFDVGGLHQHGMHLADVIQDIHVPVRLLIVDVVDTLPVRSAASLNQADIVNELRAGSQAFIIIPAAPRLPLGLAQVNYPGGAPPAGITNPNPTITVLPSTPPDLSAFTGDGVVVRIDFPADDPPEENAELVFRVEVGREALVGVLNATVNYVPHFRLVLPGGGVNYQVARNAQLALDLTDGVQPGTVSIIPEGGASVQVNGNQVVVSTTATADLGPRQVRVADAANPNNFSRRTVTVA